MTPERLRPLIAFALVGLLCAAIVTVNMASRPQKVVAENKAAVIAGSGPLVVFGDELSPRRDDGAAGGLLAAAVNHTPTPAVASDAGTTVPAVLRQPTVQRHGASSKTQKASKGHQKAQQKKHRSTVQQAAPAVQPDRTPPVTQPVTPPVTPPQTTPSASEHAWGQGRDDHRGHAWGHVRDDRDDDRGHGWGRDRDRDRSHTWDGSSSEDNRGHDRASGWGRDRDDDSDDDRGPDPDHGRAHGWGHDRDDDGDDGGHGWGHDSGHDRGDDHRSGWGHDSWARGH
jgi:hypothetical protein